MNPAAPAAAAGGGPPAAGAPRPQQGMLPGLLRMGLMWFAMKQFTGSGTKAPTGPDGQVVHIEPRLARATAVDVHVYVSEAAAWQEAAAGGAVPAWVARDVPLGSTAPREVRYLYRPSPAVQNNGSVFVHAVFTPPGAAPDPASPAYDAALSWARTHQLNTWMPKRKAKDGVNLLSGKNSSDGGALPDDTVAANETVILTSYLKPNVTIVFIDDYSRYPAHKIPPHYRSIIDIDPDTNTYAPHVWFNDFWLLRDYMVPVNASLTELPLHLHLQAVAPWKVAIYMQMEQSFSMQAQWGMSSGEESDEVKRIFLEGNPVFLALTMAVSMLHSVFDVLAFKNDIGFWKENKSMLGLSARTILINAVCQAVIFLYLLDSETSMVVLFSAGIGTAIEFWKVTKAMDVSVGRSAWGLPTLRVRDRKSYSQTPTERYDAEAMRYLSYALYPLVAGYAVYSLMYKTHTSWYSWVLHSLVGAVYTFGFILMCPQLYLNYRLKSVAHLPWRQMTYKFLNTIIDDLFAFVIKMPLLHRLSVFRDDLVFLVYIYQRWIYRVDKTRANEFGYVEAAAAGAAVEGADTAAVAAAAVPADGAGGSGTVVPVERKKEL